MRFSFIINRIWLNEANQHKVSIFGGFLAIISLSLAHYAGFLMKVPLSIVAVAGLPLAKGVTATFLFYIFFCAVFARVITSIIQLAILPIFALTDRLQRGFRRKMSWSNQRRFVRSHSQTIKREGYIWIIIQSFLFVMLVIGIYIKFSMTWISWIILFLVFIWIFFSILLRSGFFFQLNMSKFLKKTKARQKMKGRFLSASFLTITSALIIGSFFLGKMRADLLRDEEPQMTITKEFSGMATVLASSEKTLLIFQKQEDTSRYIFSSPEFASSIEDKPGFTPIEFKKQ